MSPRSWKAGSKPSAIDPVDAEDLFRKAAPAVFGRYLVRERSLRHIALEEIAAATKIKLRFLEALEADDVASLPPRAFMKGFLRSYSDYVGLNGDDVVLRFEEFLDRREAEVTNRSAREGESRRSATLVKAVFFVALILGLVYAAGYARRFLLPGDRAQTDVVYPKNYLNELLSSSPGISALEDSL
ncbi:MAG: helix-turn-helix domain-containing protein, partial [Vicinamibacteria bacterium]